MKSQISLVTLLLSVAIVSGCASTQPAKPVTIPEDPTEKLIYSTQAERPGWTMEEPETTGGVMSFVGLSSRFATERGSRDDAQRHAMENVVKYMGALVKDKYERAATDFGLSSDVVDPTESARIFEKQLAVNVAKRVKMKTWYMEKWQTQTGVGYQTFVLANVPQETVEESYKSTAADMARKSEQQAKQASDETAKAQAEKAADFWKKMAEQGLVE